KIVTKFKIEKKFRVINLIDKSSLPSTLKEFKVCCLQDNKDIYLLHILENYDGKFIIFVNSKERLKTLKTKLDILNYKCYALGSNMNQRQRISSVNDFHSSKSIMISTDIAARGFDVQDIDYVIHYDLPSTRE
ncbi:MAG: ATP-dependent RNA helicase ddx24, partial [Paramarteilia canceri]